MQRKNASKTTSTGLSRLEKVVVPAKATTNYCGPVTRRQGLRSSKIEVELELSKDDTPDGDCVPCEEELIDEPGDAEVNSNHRISSICEDQEEEGSSSFVTAAEPEPTAAALSPIEDEDWAEVVRRGKELEEEESAEEEEERQRKVREEEKTKSKNKKEEEKVRQQMAKKDEKARAKEEKKEEEARLKKESTLKKQQREEENRKKAELAAHQAVRRQESMEQKRREEVHAALVKSHQKIAEEMVERAKATTRKKEQIAADMAIDLRRRLDLARGLPSSG